MESIHNFYNQQKPMAKNFGTASYLKELFKKTKILFTKHAEKGLTYCDSWRGNLNH